MQGLIEEMYCNNLLMQAIVAKLKFLSGLFSKVAHLTLKRGSGIAICPLSGSHQVMRNPDDFPPLSKSTYEDFSSEARPNILRTFAATISALNCIPLPD